MRRAIRPPVLAITGLLLVLAAVGLLARGAPSAAGSEGHNPFVDAATVERIVELAAAP